MKRFFKKTLCICLVVLMLVSIPLSANAKAVNKTPIIFIAGINSSSLYLNKGTENEQRVWLPTVDDWTPVIDFFKSLTHLEDNGYNYDSFMTQKFVPVLQNAIGPIRCDSNGNSMQDVSIDFTMQSYAENEIARAKGGIQSDLLEIAADTIGGDRVFRYSYDFRISVMDHIHILRDMVENVKNVTNSKKVRIIGVSMGGAVLNAYLNTYGHDDLESVTFLSSAAEGTNFPALMFSGTIQLNRDTIAACLNRLIGLVPSALIASLENSINQINELWSGDRITYFYNEWVKDYLGKWCGLWNLVPSDKVDSCIDFMLDKQKDAGLIAKIKQYQACQDNLHDVLNQCKKDGVKVYVLSSYNINAIPFKGNDHQNDILIDTEYCTLGATAATFPEKTLGDDYTQKVDDGKERVSCDNIVDASTCWFPDQTWIIKNMVHCMFVKKTKDNEPDQTGEFFKWFISQTDEISVESNEKYPQFLDYTKSAGSLVALEPVVIETPTEEGEKGSGAYISSAVTVYTYTQITGLGWALIIALVALIIILIAKRRNKGPIEGVLTKAEIKALPKSERKAAKKQNKARIKEWKKQQKANKKARKAELKAMPRKERKAAKKADKKAAKAARKQAKADAKAAKKQAKLDKKAAKAAKKAK
ncbi:MAG: hypothetical protein IKE65_02280 [Clostridia bacterium]|nr:hypothetical protein [Clostridia bacterium]